MRVISGVAKGRNLVGLKNFRIRPTENRVKEAWFSILQFKLKNSKVLDLFSGSGQLAIEALSRGAKFCVLVDNSVEAVKVQKLNLIKTNFLNKTKIVLCDVFKFLNKTSEKFDFIFLDPPYKSNKLIKALELASSRLCEGGTIVCEHEAELKMPLKFCNIELQKQYCYGKIKLTLYSLICGLKIQEVCEN